MGIHQRLFCQVSIVREELFWDRDPAAASPEIEIERAINFGGSDYVEHIHKKHGLSKFKEVLITSRNLSRKAVNYWCLQLKIDRHATRTFTTPRVWSPFR